MSALISEGPARHAVGSAIEAQRAIISSELGADWSEAKPGQLHRLRVAARRLLAGLELAAALGVSVPRRVPRVLQKVLDASSPLRDAQVMAQALEQLPEGKAQRLLRQRLRRHKRKQRRRTARRLARIDRAKLDAQLEHVSAATTARALLAPAGLGELALTGLLARQLLAIEGLRARAEPEATRDLHHLRLALKQYRYTLEILASQLSPEASRLIAFASQLQDELGRAHDSQVLSELVAEQAESRQTEDWKGLAETLALRSREAHQSAAASAQQVQLTWPLAGETGGNAE